MHMLSDVSCMVMQHCMKLTVATNSFAVCRWTVHTSHFMSAAQGGVLGWQVDQCDLIKHDSDTMNTDYHLARVLCLQAAACLAS